MANKENPIPRTMAYRLMLVKVARNIGEDPLSQMKFICKDFLPKSVSEKQNSATPFFEFLEEQLKMNEGNVEFLKQLLESVERPAELEIVKKYENKYITDYEMPNGPAEEDNDVTRKLITQPEDTDKALDQELEDAFEYLKENLGRRWRELARVSGLTETDIHSIEEAYPRLLKEQGYQMLLLWKKKKRAEANIEELGRNLRKKQYNQLANRVKEGKYYS